jgi:hypothetical protein
MSFWKEKQGETQLKTTPHINKAFMKSFWKEQQEHYCEPSHMREGSPQVRFHEFLKLIATRPLLRESGRVAYHQKLVS